MKITHRFYEKEGVQVLVVHNLLHETENKQILKAAISRIEKGFTKFVVDFSEMKYMNSVGLSFLIGLLKRINATDGKLALANVNKTITKLLLITKVNTMFTIKKSVEEAIRETIT